MNGTVKIVVRPSFFSHVCVVETGRPGSPSGRLEFPDVSNAGVIAFGAKTTVRAGKLN